MKTIVLISTLLLAPTFCGAADPVPVQISAGGNKPMMEICAQISDIFHWRVTFEEAPAQNAKELIKAVAPNGRPITRTMAEPVSFLLPAKGAETMQTYRRKVMDLALDAYAASGNRAAYTYSEDDEYIHVVPVAVKARDGITRPTESVLNTKVTIQRGMYSLMDIVSAVISQVGNQTGTTISLATFPTNIFLNSTVTEEADGEPAKELLMRVFDEINGPRYAVGVPPVRLYWVLTYMADWSQYLFNVSTLSGELDEATVRRVSRTGATSPLNSAPEAAPAKAGFVKGDN